MSRTSRRWAEFRFAVVGHLVFSDIGKGKLKPELKSLSTTKWKHPISGARITLGFSTIERWYYIALTKTTAPICALTKRRRRDAGVPRSLTKQVRHHLVRQAERNSSWTYAQHHNSLLSYLKERERAFPPGYSTVRRYLRSISQDTANTKIVRLEGLVAHLRRALIVQSTISRLLRAPEVRTNTPPLKFRRFQPDEKAYILTRLRDFRSTAGSQAAFCCGIGISTARMERWLSSHRRYGQAGLHDRGRRKFPNRTKALATKETST